MEKRFVEEPFGVSCPVYGACRLARANCSNFMGYVSSWLWIRNPNLQLREYRICSIMTLLQPHSTGSLHALLRLVKPRWLSNEALHVAKAALSALKRRGGPLNP